MEDFLPVGRIQAKHTHELGELTHQTGNNAAHRGEMESTHRTLAASGAWLWAQERATLAGVTSVIIAAW